MEPLSQFRRNYSSDLVALDCKRSVTIRTAHKRMRKFTLKRGRLAKYKKRHGWLNEILEFFAWCRAEFEPILLRRNAKFHFTLL
jgi:hypothetical protein